MAEGYFLSLLFSFRQLENKPPLLYFFHAGSALHVFHSINIYNISLLVSRFVCSTCTNVFVRFHTQLEHLLIRQASNTTPC